MNIFTDANVIYDAGTKSISGSKWKYESQYFEMNHLLETAKLQKKIIDGTYHPGCGNKFLINERGKPRYITSNSIEDRTVYHILSDDVLRPSIDPYIIYENTASQKGKGVGLFRKQLENTLHSYYRKYNTNIGYILLTDFSGYYPNMPHDICKGQLLDFIYKSNLNLETKYTAYTILCDVFKTFEIDVSRFSDEEIEHMYSSKIDPMMNVGIPREQLTGDKFLKKGVDIGSQPSQDAGIIHPYRIDNYAKIVRSDIDGYGRYSDDIWAISRYKDTLYDLIDEFRSISNDIGLIINEKKTRVVDISKPFRILQIQYWLTDTGELVKKINPKSVTRERRKLKAYKRLLDNGTLKYDDIENSFKSWISDNYKIMSREQINNMSILYYKLFGRLPSWKKGHGRIKWLMRQAIIGCNA